MTTRPILRMGHPLLRKPSAPLSLEEIRSPATARLMQDMRDTMEAAEGIGIAAPQIGVLKRAAWVGLEDEGGEQNPRYPESSGFELLAVFNPTVRVLNPDLQRHWEGCLSVPGLRGEVARPTEIEVTYFDFQARRQIRRAEGFSAAVFLHEIDHLDGILYPDRISGPGKLSFLEEHREFGPNL